MGTLVTFMLAFPAVLVAVSVLAYFAFDRIDAPPQSTTDEESARGS
jgi:hypothetical protein